MHFTVDIFATHRNPYSAKYSLILRKYNANDINDTITNAKYILNIILFVPFAIYIFISIF
jgi:hypothetical protein